MKKSLYLIFLIYIFEISSLSAQTITITTPNGGENWQNSNSYGIVWVDDISAFVKIELYKGGAFYSPIIATTPSNGFYLWTPNVSESGTDYKIKITSTADSSVFDFSDDNFSITKSEITITSPNGGENLQTSYPYGIVWSDNILGPVKIELYKGGMFYSTIVDTTPSNGFYLWSVDAAESGSDYKVKVTSLNSSNDFDFSDADFSIAKSEITILTPNGGETLLAGTENSLIWTDNILSPVKIELYKGGGFYSTIIDTTPSNGFYLWTIDNGVQNGADYKIKVTSLASNNDFDFSDGNFTIDNPNGIDEIINKTPKNYTLMQNYPNPFNPATSIVYGLPHPGQVKIVLFNAIGQQVDVIFEGYKEAGYYKIQFDASSLNSGVYFYKIQATSPLGQAFIETKKMLLLK